MIQGLYKFHEDEFEKEHLLHKININNVTADEIIWLQNNNINFGFYCMDKGKITHIWFDKEEDRVMFILRWK